MRFRMIKISAWIGFEVLFHVVHELRHVDRVGLEDDLVAVAETEVKGNPLPAPRITGARGIGGLMLHILETAPVADDLIEPLLMAVVGALAIVLDDASPNVGGAR